MVAMFNQPRPDTTQNSALTINFTIGLFCLWLIIKGGKLAAMQKEVYIVWRSWCAQATGIPRYLVIHSRMRGAVVARVIPVPLWQLSHDNSRALPDIHKVIRSNRVAFIGLTTHGSLILLLLFCQSVLKDKSTIRSASRLHRTCGSKSDVCVLVYLSTLSQSQLIQL